MVDITKLMTELIRGEVCGGAAPRLCGLADGLTDGKLSDEMAKLLYKTAKSHDLAHVVAAALEKPRADGLAVGEELRGAFQKQRLTAIYRYERSNYELGVLCRVLEEAMIPFMPLKGSVLREYYPEPWMRTSCDIDVLVHEEDLSRAVAALESGAGYEEKYGSTHDVSLYSRSGVHIELHFTLMEDGRANECSELLSRAWEFSHPVGGFEYRYELCDEMFYFYHVAHMAKHFEEGGCGVRPFLDMWILNHRVGGDADRRVALLSQGNLLKFAGSCEALSEVWFGGQEHNELTMKMQDYLMNAGVYGNVENRVVINYAKRGSKIGYILSRIWTPYEKLKVVYPSLEGKRILTPVYQIKRWFRILKESGLKKLKTEVRVTSAQSADDTQKTAEFLAELGIK